MSALKAFLQPTVAGRTKEIFLSERFQGEDGKPAPFTIKAITQEENERLSRVSRIRETVKGQPVERLDNIQYTKRLVLACVQEPDFSQKEICDYYGVVNPMDVPGKMLSVGEYNALVDSIMKINGVGEAQDKLEEAKNS